MSTHSRDAHLPAQIEQVGTRRSSRWHLWLGVAVVALVSGITHARAIRTVKYHPDELDWTTRTYFYRLAFIDRDFDHWLWRSYDGIDQPHVADFLIGASFHFFGQPLPEVPSTTQSWRDVDAPRGVRLRVGRLPCALLGSMVAPLVCLMGVMISGRLIAGLTAGLLYAVHPLAEMCQVRAMSDGPLMFFSSLGMCFLVAAFPVAESSNACRAFSARGVAFLAFGTLAHALALGTKLTGIFVIMAMAGSVTLKAVWQIGTPRSASSSPTAAWMLWAIAAVLLTASWSVIVNPTLYQQPVSQFQSMLEHRLKVAEGQKANFQRDAMNDTSVKFGQVFRRLSWDYSPVPSLTFRVVQLGLFAIGLVGAVIHEFFRLRGPHGPSRAMPVLAWACVLATVLTPALPLDWPRYYLPYLPCWLLLVGCGTSLAADWLVRVPKWISSFRGALAPQDLMDAKSSHG